MLGKVDYETYSPGKGPNSKQGQDSNFELYYAGLIEKGDVGETYQATRLQLCQRKVGDLPHSSQLESYEYPA